MRSSNGPCAGPRSASRDRLRAIGLLVGVNGAGIITPTHHSHAATLVLEATLVVVLFTGAMAINASAWRRETPLPGRLLAIGLPLSLVAGWAIAVGMFPSLGLWDAAVLAVVLVPTDAALGQAVVANRRVPRLIRHGLNVESGMNDGLALPFLVIFLALAQEQDGVAGSGMALQVFLRALLASAVIGLATGWAGSRSLRWAIGRGWSGRHWRSIALLAMATLSYVAADAIEGSGFIAVWVAGFTFGPRGLASIVFAGLVVEAELPSAEPIVHIVMLTVGLSILLHGITAVPGASRYARWYEAESARRPDMVEASDVQELRERSRVSGAASAG